MDESIEKILKESIGKHVEISHLTQEMVLRRTEGILKEVTPNYIKMIVKMTSKGWKAFLLGRLFNKWDSCPYYLNRHAGQIISVVILPDE